MPVRKSEATKSKKKPRQRKTQKKRLTANNKKAKKPWKLQFWRGGALIGKGQYGCVFDKEDFVDMDFVPFRENARIKDKEHVVVKLQSREAHEHEKHIVENLPSPDDVSVVPEYFGYFDSEIDAPPNGSSCNPGYGIVMERMEVSLEDNLKASPPVIPSKETLAKFIAGLKDLHAAGILHCDIKPANIMVRNGQLVLVDWGFSQRKDEVDDETIFGCTPMYSSPTLYLHGKNGHQYIKEYKKHFVDSPRSAFVRLGIKENLDTFLMGTTSESYNGYLADLEERYKRASDRTAYLDFIDMFSAAVVLIQVMTASGMHSPLMPFISEEVRSILNFDSIFGMRQTSSSIRMTSSNANVFRDIHRWEQSSSAALSRKATLSQEAAFAAYGL